MLGDQLGMCVLSKASHIYWHCCNWVGTGMYYPPASIFAGTAKVDWCACTIQGLSYLEAIQSLMLAPQGGRTPVYHDWLRFFWRWWWCRYILKHVCLKSLQILTETRLFLISFWRWGKAAGFELQLTLHQVTEEWKSAGKRVKELRGLCAATMY